MTERPDREREGGGEREKERKREEEEEKEKKLTDIKKTTVIYNYKKQSVQFTLQAVDHRLRLTFAGLVPCSVL